jgi:hypothetical protein
MTGDFLLNPTSDRISPPTASRRLSFRATTRARREVAGPTSEHPKTATGAERFKEVFDVAVDLRRGSPTYGRWDGLVLSAENRKAIYVPPGFAHGFCVTSEAAEVLYMTTEEYSLSHVAGVIWNDPDLAIRWPVADPQLSERDRHWPRLRDADNNFAY